MTALLTLTLFGLKFVILTQLELRARLKAVYACPHANILSPRSTSKQSIVAP